jgi:hypothetical protein
MLQPCATIRSLARRILLHGVVVAAIAAVATTCRADGPVHFFAERTFEIPFEMDAGRPVKQVILHASSDGKRYTRVASAAP